MTPGATRRQSTSAPDSRGRPPVTYRQSDALPHQAIRGNLEGPKLASPPRAPEYPPARLDLTIGLAGFHPPRFAVRLHPSAHSMLGRESTLPVMCPPCDPPLSARGCAAGCSSRTARHDAGRPYHRDTARAPTNETHPARPPTARPTPIACASQVPRCTDRKHWGFSDRRVGTAKRATHPEEGDQAEVIDFPGIFRCVTSFAGAKRASQICRYDSLGGCTASGRGQDGARTGPGRGPTGGGLITANAGPVPG